MAAVGTQKPKGPLLGRLSLCTKDMPIVFRLGALTTAPLLVVLTMSISNYVVMQEAHDDFSDARLHPTLTTHLRDIATELHREQNAANQVLVNRTADALAAMATQRQATDAAVDTASRYFYHHSKTLRTGEFLTNLGLQGLVQLRSHFDNGEADRNDVALRYGELRHGIVMQAWTAVRGSQREQEEMDSEYAALLTLSFAGAFARLEQAGVAAKLSATTPEEDVAADGKWRRYAALSQMYLNIFSQVTSEDERRFYRAVAESDHANSLRAISADLTKYRLTPDARQAAESFNLGQWNDDHNRMLEATASAHQWYTDEVLSGLDDAQSFIDVGAALDLALIVFVGWSLVWLVVGVWLHHRNYAFEAKKSAQLIAMLENLNRVSEYATHFSFFDLTVPHTAQGRKITQLENILMRAMSALKVVAPAITPTVFRERFVCGVDEVSGAKKPCAMEMMMNCLPGHLSTTSQTRLSLLTEEDTRESKAIKQMSARARLGLQVREATILTVTTTFLHKLVAEERDGMMDGGLRMVDRHLPKFVTVIEQVVMHNGGLVHRMAGDRLLCIWNIPKDCPNHQAHGCRAALQASARLRALTEKFEGAYVGTAVTSGEVVFGNVGFEPVSSEQLQMQTAPDVSPGSAYAVRRTRGGSSHGGSEASRSVVAPDPCSRAMHGLKTFEVYGPCVTYGARVVYFQKLHSTHSCALCDQTSAHAVREMFAVKPLELVRLGHGEVERIYEIVGTRRGSQAESQVKLDQYTAAFELFERRKLKEADKAFRAYTKVYGYDSSVERIQTLIGERKCIDDSQADEKKYLNP